MLMTIISTCILACVIYPIFDFNLRKNYVNMTKKLENISSWLYCNRLLLNIEKSVYITFGNYCDSVPDNIEIKINGLNLMRAESCKYLGLIYDYNMKWNIHINNIVKKRNT